VLGFLEGGPEHLDLVSVLPLQLVDLSGQNEHECALAVLSGGLGRDGTGLRVEMFHMSAQSGFP
jgi:hypothetical protein